MKESRLIDVATTAGVSLRTASRVLNGDHRVASATRERVYQAMRELRFEPDAMARSLRAGTDTAIGLVVESIADPFFAELAHAVEAELAAQHRAVLIASTRRDGQQEHDVVRRLIQRRVAGLLVVPTGTADWVGEAPVPVVLVDRAPVTSQSQTRVDVIGIDDYQAAFDAVTHLIEHGHERIAYVGDSSAIPTSAARLRGYRAALSARQLPVLDELVTATGTTSSQAAQATHALLDIADLPGAAPIAPSAIFSATTRASLGVIPVLHARGRTDLAVVGLGDFAMADALRPAVTVIDHSGARLGTAAAQRLLARIADPTLPVEHRRLDTPLIPRGSGELRP
jgi:LacI family transcriptional regulator